MYRSKTHLMTEIQRAVRRWRRGVVFRGLGLFLGVFAAGLLGIILLRHLWRDFPWLIPLLAAATLGVLTYVTIKHLFLPLQRDVSAERVARSIEIQHPELEDRLVTAVERIQKTASPADDWLRRLVRDAVDKSEHIALHKQVSVKGYRAWQGLFVASLALLGGILLNMGSWQGDIREMVRARFVPPKPLVALQVLPGDSHIRRGTSVKVQAILSNLEAKSGLVFYAEDDTSWQSARLERFPSSGDYSYQFFDVQKPFKYYVKIDNEISEIYDITVFDAPEVKRIDLTYLYPKYTDLPRRFERDGGDIWAPVGTSIKVHVLSTTRIAAAELYVGEMSAKKMQLVTDYTAVGQFKVTEDSNYRIRLINREKLDNAPLSEYFIHALKDEPPSITLKKPGQDLRATMLEEVPVVVDVEDDFGLEYAKLVITVNTRPDIEVALERSGKAAPPADDGLSLRHEERRALVYLEDLNVRPGDFVTYYIAAKDRGRKDETKTDMYFIDVRNFDMVYTAGTSQGGGGGGGAQLDLSITQREIITATNRLIRQRETLAPETYKDNREKIREAQGELRKTVEEMSGAAKMSLGLDRGDQEQVMRKELEAAARDMLDIDHFLRKDSLDRALHFERSAYVHIVKAEMSILEKELQMSRGASGGGGSQNTDELTRLFQDEMDKLKSKYETLQQGDNNQTQQAVNEALQKVRELGRRQQNINELSRQLAQKNMSEEEKRREIKKLQRQQEQLRRDTQEAMRRLAEASRNRQQAGSQSQALNELRRASNEMSKASNSLRQQQPQSALSSGQQAQDRLKKIEDRLRKTQQNAMRDELKELKDDLQKMADRQKRLAESSAERKKTRTPAGAPRNDDLARQSEIATQKQLRENLQQAMREIENLARQAGEEPELRRSLQELEKNLERSNAGGKMQQAESALRTGRDEDAERLQRSAHNDLSGGLQQMRQITRRADGSKDEKLELALEQAQEMRRNLENRLQQQTGADQQGQQGEQPQQAEGQNTRQSQLGNPRTLDTRLTEEQIQKYQEAIWNTKQQIEQLKRQIRADSLSFDDSGDRNDLGELTDQALNAFTGIARTFRGGSRERLDELAAKLIDPLKKLEAELAAQLQLSRSKESLRTVRDQPVSPEYKKLVEEYYRALARGKSGPQRKK